jgi:hypothetical protein
VRLVVEGGIVFPVAERHWQGQPVLLEMTPMNLDTLVFEELLELPLIVEGTEVEGD